MVEAAGYSGTPLPRKLGIVPGSRVLLVGAPPEFELGPLPERTRERRWIGADEVGAVPLVSEELRPILSRALA